MSHSNIRAHAKNMRLITPKEALILPHELADKENACMS